MASLPLNHIEETSENVMARDVMAGDVIAGDVGDGAQEDLMTALQDEIIAAIDMGDGLMVVDEWEDEEVQKEGLTMLFFCLLGIC